MKHGTIDWFLSGLTTFLFLQLLRAQSPSYSPVPNLPRRADNCTGGCNYCPNAYQLSWSKTTTTRRETTTIATVFETVIEGQGTTRFSTKSDTWEDGELPINTAGTQIAIARGYTLVFPTIYLWLNGEITGKATTCTGPWFTGVTLPGPPVIGVGAVPEDDPQGMGYDLWTIPYFGDISSHIPVNVKTCDLTCGFLGPGIAAPSDTRQPYGPSVALSAAFVTATQRTTVKGDDKATPAPGQSQENPVAPTATVQSPGSSDLADSQPGGGTMTTTDGRGSTIIVQESPAMTADQQVTFNNAAGQTVVVQGATTIAPGQLVTTTDAQGSAYAVQGAGMTVTDARGSVVVIQGGTTGTLAVYGSSTVLIQQGTTRSNWEEPPTRASSPAQSATSSSKSSQRIFRLQVSTIWSLMLLPTVLISALMF